VLSELGDPHRNLRSILIVGTNGKGSTAAMLEAMLGAHGLRTGLYTSPHLIAVEERIRIGGTNIDRPSLERQLERLDGSAELTFFEAVTAAALLAFAEGEVDVAVLEAGLGGAWDATRVAASAIVGITNVGTDHCEWLGDDVASRARDKGAAVRSARRGVIGPGFDPTLRSALDAPDAVDARRLVGFRALADGRFEIEWNGRRFPVTCPLEGAHQATNLHLALALARAAEVEGIVPKLAPTRIAEGLAHTRWSGRLSEHDIGGRRVLLDGAHNPEGARALADHLAGEPIRRNLLFSCLRDKEVEAMAAALEPAVGEIVVCPLADDRAMPVDRMRRAFGRAMVADDPSAGLEALPDPVVAAGSLRLVGRLLEVVTEGDDE
jgi:dihydrofolate synthase/folylpolyglutamate synthase